MRQYRTKLTGELSSNKFYKSFHFGQNSLSLGITVTTVAQRGTFVGARFCFPTLEEEGSTGLAHATEHLVRFTAHSPI